MILVKLRGGLSNQMFQYAAARSLAHVHNTEVLIDNTWYENIPADATKRNYELDFLSISGKVAKPQQLIGTDGIKKTKLVDMPIAVSRKIFPKWNLVEERSFAFNPDFFSFPDQTCLFGYWISEKYFVGISEIIKKEFEPKNKLTGKNLEDAVKIKSTNSVSIHVRRGDFISNPELSKIHISSNLDYYSTCIQHIRKTVSQPHWFLFSDDLEWVRKNISLGNDDTTYVEQNQNEKSYEDIRLMSLCKHNIIANSSFSWWGAWLNNNPNKIVCAPDKWAKLENYNSPDIIPTSWLKF